MTRLSGLLVLAVLMATAAPARAETRFSADSGALNVRDFGAKGNGRDDDTAALLAAIAAAGDDTGAFFWRTRIVWLPAGTYLVSRSLVKRYKDGRFGSGMVLIGESEAGTTIRLVDRADGFGDKAVPRGVIMTTSKLLDGTATSGGKDYTGLGEGNDAYENFIENLTVDVGEGNPGAIGIDYLANNIGAIRDVTVTAPQSSGAIGIALTRKWPGPALLQRIEVRGFDTGIAVANTEYGVTLDRIGLRGQRRVGLANNGNAVSAARLTIDAAATAIANTAPGGLIVLKDATLRADNAATAMLFNRGAVVAHDVTLEGFSSPDNGPAPLSGIWDGEQWTRRSGRESGLEDAPPPPADPPDKWVNVLRFATPSEEDKPDITQALRDAMASGATTVYLPFGAWSITDGIVIPPTLRRFVGMNASITVRPERRPEFSRDSGMFQVNQDGPPLAIERLAFDMTDLGKQLAVQVTSGRDVTLRDIVTAGTSLLNRGRDGGRIFIEDVCCGALLVSGPKPVFARQLDTEGGDTRIVNDGAELTILGLKTEGDCTVLDNRRGANSIILGGLLYIVGDADPAVPAFRDANGGLLASFVEESFRRTSRYTVYLRGSSKVDASAFRARGYGRIVPWLSAGH